MTGRLKLPAAVIGQVAFVLAVLYVLLGGAHRDFRVPFGFSGDALEYLMQVKGTIDHGWWWSNPHVAAPSTFSQVAYPSDTNVDQAVVWLVSLATRNAGLCLNLAWMLLVALAAPVAAACLTRLGVSRTVAWIAGVLFALSPYALYRNVEHFALVMYLIPIPCTVALLVATNRLGPIRAPATLALLAGCVLVGFDYTYYAFFGCFMLIAAAGLAWIDGYRRAAAHGLIFTAAIVLATAVNLAPSIAAWGGRGAPLAVPDKTAAEAESYGLKIRQLISPAFEHPFAPFRRWTEAESRARYPTETENTRSRLGLLETVGFLVLVAAGLAPRVAGWIGDAPVIASAGRLTLAAILLGTVGGFGSLFSLLISPEIRSYNRLCGFIAFLAWVALASWLDRLWRVVAGRRRRLGAGLALAVVVVAGLLDQAPAVNALNQTHASIREEYAGLQWFAGNFERRLAPGAMVFELPALLYLNDAGHLRMQPYDLIKPYVVSRSIHWSYPALADEVVRWQQAVGRLPPSRLRRALLAAGFSAVVVDRYGYDYDGQDVVVGLVAAGGAVLAESGRYVGIGLGPPAQGDDAGGALPRWDGQFSPATNGLPECGTLAIFGIDTVGDFRAPFDPAGVTLSRSGRIPVRGWGVDEPAHDLAGDIDLLIDGEPWPTLYGLDRPDVVSRLRHPRYRPSGFLAKVPAARLTAGPHMLAVRSVSADRTCAATSGAVRLVVR